MIHDHFVAVYGCGCYYGDDAEFPVCRPFHLFNNSMQSYQKAKKGLRMGIDAELFHSLYRLNQELKELEKYHNVQCRWNPADKDYQELEHAFS